jgi:hypothetical protein
MVRLPSPHSVLIAPLPLLARENIKTAFRTIYGFTITARDSFSFYS